MVERKIFTVGKTNLAKAGNVIRFIVLMLYFQMSGFARKVKYYDS